MPLHRRASGAPVYHPPDVFADPAHILAEPFARLAWFTALAGRTARGLPALSRVGPSGKTAVTAPALQGQAPRQPALSFLASAIGRLPAPPLLRCLISAASEAQGRVSAIFRPENNELKRTSALGAGPTDGCWQTGSDSRTLPAS